MEWRPNCTQAPHYWTLWTPLGFQVEYRVMLTTAGFMPMRLDYNAAKKSPQEDFQWEWLSKKGYKVLAPAMLVCEAAYRKGTA